MNEYNKPPIGSIISYPGKMPHYEVVGHRINSIDVKAIANTSLVNIGNVYRGTTRSDWYFVDVVILNEHKNIIHLVKDYCAKR